MSGVLDKRLVFVTGKGGVGKTTVATAIGLLAARRGRRTIVAELASQRRLQRSFDRDGAAFTEVELAPGLFAISVDPEGAMREYLHVKTGLVGDLLGASKLFQTFAMAAPGMRDLLSLGKVWELSQPRRRTEGGLRYDLVIVDAPASGHCAALLRTPSTFAEIARVGPIAHQAGAIAATIADPGFTGVIAVATAEEMPVNETLWLRDALAAGGLSLDMVVVNTAYPPRFDDGDVPELHAALGRARSPLARSALRAALSEHARAETQSEQRSRLSDLDALIAILPYLFAEQLGLAELDELADVLADTM